MKRSAIGVLAFSVIVGCGFVGYLQWQNRAIAQAPYVADLPPQDSSLAAVNMPAIDARPVGRNNRFGNRLAQAFSNVSAEHSDQFQTAFPSPPPTQAMPQITFNDQPPGARIHDVCLLYTSPSPRDISTSRMPSSA